MNVVKNIFKALMPWFRLVGTFFAVYYGVAYILFALPSVDPAGEAHGYLVMDGYVKGNGVLIGYEREGKTHICFLTCKHVVMTPMLESRRSFLTGAHEEGEIYIRRPGRAYLYAQIKRIEPKRWRYTREGGYDFAWLELNDEEIAQVAGAGKKPKFFRLTDSTEDGGLRFAGDDDIIQCRVEKGSALESTMLIAPVVGDVEKGFQWDFRLTASLPFTKLAVGFNVGRSGLISDFNRTVYVEEKRGVSAEQKLNILDLSSHKNNSGSPVVAHVKVDGKEEDVLLGIVTASSGAQTGFQTLNPVVWAIKSAK